MLNDLKYAFRSLARARGFTIAVVLTVGLAIGANTAIFSVVRGILLKPLPHRDGDRLVYLRHSMDGPAGENIQFSVPEINDFRSGAQSFAGIAEYSPSTTTLSGESDAVRINVGLVTGNYLDVMGLSTVIGRPLSDRDDGAGAPPVMLLTHEFWMNRFGGDPGVVGRVVTLNMRDVEIIGVVEPAPFFPSRFDALLNMAVSSHHTSAAMVQGRAHRMTEMIARLAPGRTVDGARVEVASIRDRVQADHPEAYDRSSNYRVTVLPFKEVLGERAQLTLWLLMGAAAFVLVIAAANVVNLTLMRSVRREHELVARRALGAGVARLRKLLLAENLVLTGMGAVLGLAIAVMGMRPLVALAERYSPRASEIQLDAVVLGFALLLSLGVALLLSFVPTLPRESAIGQLIGTHRSSASLRKQRLQRTLVVAQVAVSVVLLAGAGLLTRTMLQLADVKTGLTTDNVLTLDVPLLGNGRSDAAAKELYERIRMEVAALPGVSEVGVGSVMPLRVETLQLDVRADGYTVAPGEAQPRAEFRTAGPEYFSASGIPLLQGRTFTSTDTKESQLVVVINTTLARKLFPDRDPIGQRIAWTGELLQFINVSGGDDWRTIVGVVGDTKDGGLDAEPRPVVFQPFTQQPAWGGGFVIRATADPSTLGPSVTRVVRSIVPTAPIENIVTVAQVRDQSIAPRRLNAVLVSSFGMLAVIIAAVGIAGVLAFSVSARTKEIGIRMSLGADSARVQRMVIREGGVLLGIGVVLGAAAASAGSRLIQGLLFGVPPRDPLTLGLVAVIMLVIGIGACWLPAARAARINPALTIRGQ